MSRVVSSLTADQLRQIQDETGVDVFALLDRLEKSPDERLRTAIEGARNLARLREMATHAPKPKR